MKLFDFEMNNQKYCLMKLDNYNFTIREYLLEPKEISIGGIISIQEFKAPDNYFGSLEYALRKAFKILGKQFINKKEFGLFCPTYDSLKSIFEIKPREVNQDNVDDIKVQIEKVLNHKSKPIEKTISSSWFTIS